MILGKTLISIIIKFYQKYLTHFSYGSCRYYPTCSEYARLQYRGNNFFVATFFSIKRILSCNQLFKGGIDYPKILNVKIKLSQKPKEIIFWLIPIKTENKYFIIKNFSSINLNKFIR